MKVILKLLVPNRTWGQKSGGQEWKETWRNLSNPAMDVNLLVDQIHQSLSEVHWWSLLWKKHITREEISTSECSWCGESGDKLCSRDGSIDDQATGGNVRRWGHRGVQRLMRQLNYPSKFHRWTWQRNLEIQRYRQINIQGKIRMHRCDLMLQADHIEKRECQGSTKIFVKLYNYLIKNESNWDLRHEGEMLNWTLWICFREIGKVE